jgi:hypothetical protein
LRRYNKAAAQLERVSAESEERRARGEALVEQQAALTADIKVRRCRFTLSKPMLKVPGYDI